MKINTTARHFELTPALRKHVEERLDRIGRMMERVPEVRVVLEVEKYRHCAELSVRADGLDLVARGISDDMYTSVDQAIEKLVRQVRRRKERIRARRPKTERVGRQARIEILRPAAGEEEIPQLVTTEHQEVKRLTVKQAVATLEKSVVGCLVFLHRTTGRLQVLYRRPDGHFVLVEPEGEATAAGAESEASAS